MQLDLLAAVEVLLVHGLGRLDDEPLDVRWLAQHVDFDLLFEPLGDDFGDAHAVFGTWHPLLSRLGLEGGVGGEVAVSQRIDICVRQQHPNRLRHR